jgi:flagellar basal body-associated protein FliL
MAAPEPDPEKQSDRKGRTLVLIMLGIVLASIAAFLVLRPDPSGTGHPTSTSSHAPPSQ